MTVHPLIEYSPREAGRTKEVEPRVVTADVARILREFTKPDDEDAGSSVSLVAERANTSTRTVYRVLQESTETINLNLADHLCVAAGGHLAACRLAWRENDDSYTYTPYNAPARSTL